MRKSMESVIPQMIAFLGDSNDSLREAGAKVLLNLSEEGNISNFLMCMSLMRV